jgi:predicted transcriptional regulator
MAEFGSGQVVGGDEVLAWIDGWGFENEPEPPR